VTSRKRNSDPSRVSFLGVKTDDGIKTKRERRSVSPADFGAGFRDPSGNGRRAELFFRRFKLAELGSTD
jgi:hypothetical protein